MRCLSVLICLLFAPSIALGLDIEPPGSADYPFSVTGKTGAAVIVSVTVNGERQSIKRADQSGRFRFEFSDGPTGDIVFEFCVDQTPDCATANILVTGTTTAVPQVVVKTPIVEPKNVSPPEPNQPPEKVEPIIRRENLEPTPLGLRVTVITLLAVLTGVTLVPAAGALTDYDPTSLLLIAMLSVPIPFTVHFGGKAFNNGFGHWWATLGAGYVAGAAFLFSMRALDSDAVGFTPLVTVFGAILGYEFSAHAEREAFRKRPATFRVTPFGMSGSF